MLPIVHVYRSMWNHDITKLRLKPWHTVCAPSTISDKKKTNHFDYIALGIRSESFRTIWNKPKYTADKQYLQYEKYAVQSYLSILTYCLLMLPIVGTHELAVSCIESDSEKLIKMYLCHNVRFHVHIKTY